MSRSAANSAAAAAATPSHDPAHTVAAPVAPAALPSRPADFYPNARARYVTQWVVPGAAVSGVLGGVVGATLAAVLQPRRPMLSTSLTVASKFSFCSLLYLGSVSSWTKHAPPSWNEPRLAVHLGLGAFTGAMLGSVTGRSWGALGNRAGAVARGGLIGAALAIPAWWVIEGRHPKGVLDDMGGTANHGHNSAAPASPVKS